MYVLCHVTTRYRTGHGRFRESKYYISGLTCMPFHSATIAAAYQSRLPQIRPFVTSCLDPRNPAYLPISSLSQLHTHQTTDNLVDHHATSDE
jgi:hypothetical protein